MIQKILLSSIAIGLGAAFSGLLFAILRTLIHTLERAGGKITEPQAIVLYWAVLAVVLFWAYSTSNFRDRVWNIFTWTWSQKTLRIFVMTALAGLVIVRIFLPRQFGISGSSSGSETKITDGIIWSEEGVRLRSTLPPLLEAELSKEQLFRRHVAFLNSIRFLESEEDLGGQPPLNSTESQINYVEVAESLLSKFTQVQTELAEATVVALTSSEAIVDLGSNQGVVPATYLVAREKKTGLLIAILFVENVSDSSSKCRILFGDFPSGQGRSVKLFTSNMRKDGS